MADEKKLTDKQAAFVEEYPVDWNGTQAYIRAGFSPNGASVEAHRLLAKPRIAELIDIKRQEHFTKIGMNREAIAEEIAGIGSGKVGDERNGEKLRYHDKLSALDKMAKISGMYTDKSELTVKGINITIGDKDADCA